MSKRVQILILTISIYLGSLLGCDSPVNNVVGISSGGYIVGLKALYGNAGLSADGTSQATLRIEVFNTAGQLVDGATVFLTTTLGTLAQVLDVNGAFTTDNGIALATLTAGTQPGTAYVVATVENVSATVAVEIVNTTATVG